MPGPRGGPPPGAACGRRRRPGDGERRCDDRSGTVVAQGELWLLEPPNQKHRPVLVVSRDEVIPVFNNVVVAPVTSTIHSIPTCIPVGPPRASTTTASHRSITSPRCRSPFSHSGSGNSTKSNACGCATPSEQWPTADGTRDARAVRALRRATHGRGRGVHLLIRVLVLPHVYRRDEPRLPELRRRVGTAPPPAGRNSLVLRQRVAAGLPLQVPVHVVGVTVPTRSRGVETGVYSASN